MIKIIKKKRNPPDFDILSLIKNHQFLTEGAEGLIYYFSTKSNMQINKITIPPGEYVIKLYKYSHEITADYLKLLNDLSRNNLIPKVYVNNKNYMIQSYINGNILNIKNLNKNLFKKIEKLLTEWHDLGFYHGDLCPKNILISNKNEIFFIDPYPIRRSFNEENDFDKLDFYYRIIK